MKTEFVRLFSNKLNYYSSVLLILLSGCSNEKEIHSYVFIKCYAEVRESHNMLKANGFFQETIISLQLISVVICR